MALKLKYPRKEDIPENLAAAYVEGEDGEYVLDAELPDTGKLERALETERARAKDAEKAQREAERKLGDALRQLDAKEASGAQTEEKIAAMLAKWEKDKQDAVAAAIAEKDEVLAKVQERVTKYELDDTLAQSFTKAGGRGDRSQRALALAKLDGWRLVDGKPVKVDSTGQVETVTPDDYFGKVFRKEVPEFYEGSKGDGGFKPGVPAGPGGSGTGAKKPTEWSEDERRQFIMTNGGEAYSMLLQQQVAESATRKPGA